MTFQETLDKHLRAIQERDLQSLAETIADDDFVLVMADGKLVRSPQEFLELHSGWLEMDTWSMGISPVQIYEDPQLGVAVLHLDYRETPPDRPAIRQQSYLTLVFQCRDGRWVMVQDQNTPIKQA